MEHFENHILNDANNNENLSAKNEAAFLIMNEGQKIYIELHVGTDGSWDYTLYDGALQEIDGGQIGEEGNETDFGTEQSNRLSLSDAVMEICQLHDLDKSNIAELSYTDFEEKLERNCFRYYSTQRPVMPGTFPNGTNKPMELHNFDECQTVENVAFEAWGYLEYPMPLTKQQIEDYELKAAPVTIEIASVIVKSEELESDVGEMDTTNNEMKHDTVIEAYVTNLGKYNEGHLIGEWVKFPTTYEEMKKVFDRIGIDGVRYEEWFITDYECSIDGIYDQLGEYESLESLNYLAVKLDEMSTYDIEKLEAIIQHDSSYTRDVKGLINLTANLDTYDFLEGVHNEEDLGSYWVEESGAYDLKAMGNLANYIDYQRFGRDIAMDEGGTFTDKGYVRNTDDSIVEIFDGSHEDIPLEYRIMSNPDLEQEDSIEVLESFDPEKQVQNADCDMYGIYQLKKESDLRDYSFEGLERLKIAGLEVKRENYELVYHAPLTDTETLESLYERFNLRHPEDFRGHSMSVSDVIVLHQNGVNNAYYCDSFGFAEINSFLLPQQVVVDMKTSGLSVEGHVGAWHAIDFKQIDGGNYFLMEHDTYGEDAAGIIVNSEGKMVLDEIFNGFDEETVDQIKETCSSTRENWLKNAEMSSEDDYSMLDGIINNSVSEAVKRQDEKPSVLGKLKELKADISKTEKKIQVTEKAQNKLEI